ncbi:MAG: Chromosome partition protein Smc [Nitrospira sp.]|nr:MAG: Chromosome partition protein Smc [Nitrospira sp.]
MRLESIRIKNLRSFSDVTVPFNDYTCLVGPNGSGKSTILCALNVFFHETENSGTDLSQLDREDFHQKNTAEPIEITVTFTDLSPEAQQDFSNYYRQGKLIISAVATFNDATGKAEVRQYGQRLAMPGFKEFFRAVGDNKKVSELKTLYTEIQKHFGDLPAPGTKDAMIEALRKYETDHPDQCELIASEDQFYGVSKGANRLAQYIQWVYVPAVKDAATEQLEARNTALGKLLARTVRAKTNFEEAVKALRTGMQEQYQQLLDQNQEVLKELSDSLQIRLTEWAHPEATLKLEWRQDPDKSVRVEEPLARIIAGEGNFEGELPRFGHGLQRSYLLALLHELASSDDKVTPRLILGCEEPELYQHPPQARHLATVLQDLSKANSQVIVSTHSPLFVSGEGFEDVRMVRKDAILKYSTVTYMSYKDIADAVAAAMGETPSKPQGVLAKIHQTLQPSLNEMFFTSRLILVEGLEDVAYLSSYLHLLNKWDQYRRSGCHIVPVNAKSEMLRPVVIAKHIGIPTFVVFDSDADEQHQGNRAKHEKDNKALLALLGKANENPLPTTSLWGPGFVMWRSNIGALIRAEIGAAEWSAFQAEADKQYGHAGGLRKNTLHIGFCLAQAWKSGKKSPSLERLCNEILNPAISVQ